MINGVGGSILFVAEGNFVSLCATDENKGVMNSVFWGIFQTSSLTGPIISALILQYGASELTLMSVFGALAILSPLIFCFLKEPHLGENPVLG